MIVAIAATLVVLSGFELSAFADDEQQQSANNEQAKVSAQALVEEALYHQIYGRNDLRNQLLSKAVEIQPDLKMAQWYQGKIQIDGDWLGEKDVASQVDSSDAFKEYEAFRKGLPDTEEGNLSIANWCRDNSLDQQERAHLNRVVWHNPNNVDARRRAGFVRSNNRWILESDLADQLADYQTTADRYNEWSKRIRRIQSFANSGSEIRRRKAIEKIQELDDAGSNVALEYMLGGHSEPVALAVVNKIAESFEVESTDALSRFAVFNPWKSARDAAATALKDREKYDYVPTMLASMSTPVISRFQVVPGNRGSLVYRHLFFQEGQNENRVVEIDVIYERNRRPGTVGIDSLQRSIADIQASSQQNLMAQQMQNLNSGQTNARITSALRIATEQEFGLDARAWWNWWNDFNEIYLAGSKPVTSERYNRSITVNDSNLYSFDRAGPGGVVSSAPRRASYECLVAGTQIWTVTGTKSVEDIGVGDMVLSQNLESGELSYKPVIRPTVRPKTPTICLVFSRSQTVTASGGHPFFVSGEGWIKARNLKPGMLLHTTEGSLEINETRPGPTVELYNMVVADNNNYFVGDSKILSHDNTLRESANVLLPGLKK
ncbi:HINT domain-containing protein [Vicingaceae bacterium]|nr:HINT domain-containing protein [Vicingaceae bacterium]